MTVAYITMGFPKGAETFACTDIRALRQAGVDVTVHSMRFRPEDAASLLEARGLRGLPVEYATVVGTLRGLARALVRPQVAMPMLAWILGATWRQPWFLLISVLLVPRSFEILARIERDRPDVVHLFWGHYPSLVAYLVRRRRCRSVISMFLGAYDLTYRYGPSGRIAREADLVWTHAHENVGAIARLGVRSHQLAVVHRGVDVGSFRPAVQKIPGRIVSAARLCRDKRVDHVIQAFALVRAAWPEASLVVLGDGPDRHRLEAMAEHLGLGAAVRFAGHVPQARVRDEMAVAELFMLMSQEDTERLTNSIKEAMACQCLCIVTPSPGLEELLVDGMHGFVVERGDVTAAAAKALWARRHPREAAVVCAAAAERIRTAFDVAAAMTAYQERWAAVVASREPVGVPAAISTVGRVPRIPEEAPR